MKQFRFVVGVGVLVACINAVPQKTEETNTNQQNAVQPTKEAASDAETPCQLPMGKSVWRNELKSTMTMDVDSSGKITGEYQTGVGCKPGKKQPLVGACNGYAITFSVNFKECGSTTAWTGTLAKASSGKPDVIRTLWHLGLGHNPPSWDSIVAGTDCFVPENSFPYGLAYCSLPQGTMVKPEK